MARAALSATRAVRVVDLLVSNPTERFSLAEIQRRAEINPASAHALLNALTQSGYVQRHPRSKAYSLGPALVAAGIVALEHQPALSAGRAILDGLSAEVDHEILLTAPAETDIVVVGRSAESSGFGRVIHVGQRMPLRPPYGTVFMAWGPDQQVDDWLDRANQPLLKRDRDVQIKALSLVRSRGYSLALESDRQRNISNFVKSGTNTANPTSRQALSDMVGNLNYVDYHVIDLQSDRRYDLALMAAPIFDATERVVAALTVNGLKPNLAGHQIESMASAIVGASTKITRDIYGRPPNNHEV